MPTFENAEFHEVDLYYDNVATCWSITCSCGQRFDGTRFLIRPAAQQMDEHQRQVREEK